MRPLAREKSSYRPVRALVVMASLRGGSTMRLDRSCCVRRRACSRRACGRLVAGSGGSACSVSTGLWGGHVGDHAGSLHYLVNVLFGLFLALLYGLAFAGCDGADAFGGVASLSDEDACPPVGAVWVDGPCFALLGDFGGGDVA